MAAAAPTLPSLMAKFLLMTVALGFRTHMRDLLFCLVWAFPFVLMIYSRKATRKAATRPPLCGSTYRQERRCREEHDRPHDRGPAVWTFEENKRFENALAMLTTNEANPYASFFGFAAKVAPEFPGKSVWQVHSHVAALVHDLGLIDSGEIPFPEQWTADGEGKRARGGGDIDNDSSSSSSSGRSKAGRRRWIIWTDDERESFLRGLDIYGFGHWKLISANVVFSKTWREVASYARRHFYREDRPTSQKRADEP